jgi:protein involved in polysaccharide export with SLBB domain
MKTESFAQLRFLALFLLLAFGSGSVAALDYPMLKPQKEVADKEPQAVEKTPPPESYLDKAIDAKTYIVGPGDVFKITLYGITAEPILAEILPEGIISLPDMGEIILGQITLDEAKQRITNTLVSRYRDRAVGVSLARVRVFKVSVTGGVEKPSLVAVSAADRVSEAIARAGGLQRKGSLRNIQLVNIDHDTVIADLAYFNSTGSTDANPYLHEGQVVFVPVVSDSFNKIEAFGALNAPGKFEFRPGDRISELLDLAFGASIDADLDGAELVRFESSGAQVSMKADLRAVIADRSSAANLALCPDDRLFVRTLAGFRSKEQVTIEGEVKYPGAYPIDNEARTLRDLVARAGGMLESASLSEAEMFRQSRYSAGEEKTSFDRLLQLTADKLTDFELQYLKETSGRRQGKVAVDFELLFKHNLAEHDVPLMDGDLVRIPAKSFAVTVLGRVVNPGLVPYKENEIVDYYIRLAGGYGYKADKRDIRIIKSSTGAVIKPDSKTPIAMGDRIMVPQQKATDLWKFARDLGLFLANLATVYVVVDQVTK